jgi:hypothetical protein
VCICYKLQESIHCCVLNDFGQLLDVITSHDGYFESLFHFNFKDLNVEHTLLTQNMKLKAGSQNCLQSF